MDEVSLVDSPANEVEFLITKNLEDGDMAKEQTNKGDVERVSVEQPATGGEAAVAKAMEHVDSIIERFATLATTKNEPKTEAPPTEPAPAPEAKTDPAPTEESSEDIEKAKAMTPAAMLKALGISGDALTKAVDKLKAMGFDPNQKFPTAQKPSGNGVGTAKSEDKEPNMFDTLADAITKAKQFTPGRIAKIKEAMETLKLLVAEVDPGDSPATTAPTSPMPPASGIKDLTSPSPAPTFKADEEVAKALVEVANVVKGLSDQLKGVAERVDGIEKARPASESVEGSGGTDNKVQKSFWSGLL